MAQCSITTLHDATPTIRRGFVHYGLVTVVGGSNTTGPDTIAVAWGGFADIWKGTFKGELVALKVLRLYGQPEDQKALISVCISIARF